ncbi:MAG: hypothetical protein K5770_18655, partial [Lachnospiraceae bacterium]|nr:hypothetical protein [Lachnospiraceae bacterium]
LGFDKKLSSASINPFTKSSINATMSMRVISSFVFLFAQDHYTLEDDHSHILFFIQLTNFLLYISE